MKPWRRAWDDGTTAGAVASILSASVLALASKKEAGSACSCLNATSHWIWGDGAALHDAPSLRHTAVGYLIHHAASCFWGVLYERGLGEQLEEAPAVAKVGAGMAAAAFACVVDYRMVPHRLSPGFELRLSRGSIVAGYVAFGLGLALPGILRAGKARSRVAAP